MKKTLPIIATILFAFVLWYFALPPINISSPEFWVYLIMVILFAGLAFAPSILLGNYKKKRMKDLPKVFNRMVTLIGVIVVGIVLVNLFCSPLFNSSKYANRIVVDETKEFSEDVKEVDFTKIPLLDKSSSQKLGDRKMGQATEWVSQFYVSDLYTQINYNNKIVRVTPIEYAGLIKYFTNRDEGIKGYITVNSVDGESKLETLEKGMKYMPSAYFFENLYRKLRIDYPTEIFEEVSFEIDNDGNPYWIVPTIKYAGVGMREEISGVIILDPITGTSKKYSTNEIPSWVDHAYPPYLIIDQLNNWGEYKEGFINSIFGQKNVVNTTEGYNYLVMDDDVYLYTGITSVSTDESNLGFVLVNMRTKETHYYSAPGAEEYSAMASAQGLVQEKKYVASFPLLINLKGKPTYLLSLKDNAGLVKMYALVDVADYQKVIVNDSSLGIEAAVKKYLGEVETEIDNSKLQTKEITIKSLTTAIIDGNTHYYFTDKEDNLYSASIKVDKNILPFLKVKDKVKVTYQQGEVSVVTNIEK